MDKPFFLGSAVLYLSKLLIYETYSDKLQPFLGEKDLHLHYMETDNFVLGVNAKDIIKELKYLEVLFDFSNLNENHELFSNKKSNW